MSTARGRTAVVAVLAAAVGARVPASEPLGQAAARIAADPASAFIHATDGWSTAGTLGSPSAQGLRELPLSGWYWLGARAGLSAEMLAIGLHVAVVVLAVLGAVRLARVVASRLPPTGHRLDRTGAASDTESWAPWVAAVLFAVGPVLVAALVRSPLDALAVAALPWLVAPILGGRPGWRAAAASTLWLGVAGLAHPLWAATALLVGVVAVVGRARRRPTQAVRWALLAVLASAWWIVLTVWELRHARDAVALLVPRSYAAGFAEALAWPGLGQPWVTLLALSAFAAGLAALVLRAPGLPRLTSVLLALGAAGVLAWGGGWLLPFVVSVPTSAPPALLGPPLGCAALAGLLAWVPLVEDLLRRFGERTASRRRPTPREVLLGALAGTVVLSSVTGLVVATQERQPSEPDLPGLWSAVADWSASAPPGRVLVVPASAGAGSPELAGALAGRSWVSRSSTPASGADATSALDELLWRLVRGLGSEGTAEALRRMGVSFVLIRQDGSAAADRDRPAGLVREALQDLGATRTAVLTEGAGKAIPPAVRLVDFGIRAVAPQVEVWEVPGGAEASVYTGAPLEVAGGPGAVADLGDAGISRSTALRIVEGGGDSAPDVLSDSARRRDIDQRLATDPFGPELFAGEPRHVVPPAAGAAPTALRRLSGARAVAASSSAADLGEPVRRAGSDASAAVDGNAFTAWVSAAGATTDEWWEIELDRPTDLSSATVRFLGNRITGFPVERVRLETDRETTNRTVTAGEDLTLDLEEPATRLRITITEVKPTLGDRDSVGIAEFMIPDLEVRSKRAVGGSPSGAWVLAARSGSHDACVPAAGSTGADATEPATTCNAGISVEGPEIGTIRRTVTSEEDVTVDGFAWARAAATDRSAALADRLATPSVVVTGSSVVAPDLDVRPQAAADGNPGTAWRPAVNDRAPVLTFSFRNPATISGVQLVPPDAPLWSTPRRVRVETSGETQGGPRTTHEADVAAGGWIWFPRVRTQSIKVTVLEDSGVKSTSSYAGGQRDVPVAVAEVNLLGGPAVRFDADTVHRLPCGSGPAVTVGGTTVSTAVSASAGEIVEGAMLRADFCSGVELPAGEAEVTAAASFSWTPFGLVLQRADTARSLLGKEGAREPGRARVASLVDLAGPQTIALLRGGSDPRVLALATPAHDGWTARAGQETLEPITVDGWAQGWILPAGADEVSLRYSAGDGLPLVVAACASGWLVTLLLALSGSAARRPSSSSTVPD